MARNDETPSQPEQTPSSDRQQSDAVGNLRPLAPKPLPPPPPPLPFKSSNLRGLPEQAAGTSQWNRHSSAVCTVCYRTGCQLPTHMATSRLTRSSKSVSPVKPSGAGPQSDPVFSSSYAYQAAQQYANPHAAIAPGGSIPSYNFPLGPEMNTPEMHRLFHTWFMIEARDAFRVPCPPELAGDLICSPFFLPALKDPLLCLAVLAGAEAGNSLLGGHQSPSVKTLTLVDHAIQQLRERIQADPNNISDITIVAATFLWVANIFLEDTEGMKSHSETVFALVQKRRGLNKLGMVGAVEQIIRWSDAMHSFLLTVPCHYRDAPDPGILFKLPSHRYGAYWDNVDSSVGIQVEATVRVACQEICRELEILEHVEIKGISMYEYARYLQRMCVLYNKTSVLGSQTYNEGPVNRCIIIAARLLHFHCLQNWKFFQAGGKRNIASLAVAIRSTGGPTFWQEDLDLLTWLLFVTVVVPVEQEEKSWCFRFLCRVVVTRFGRGARLEKRWEEKLKTSLQKFVWCDLRLDDLFQEVCLKIEDVMKSSEQWNDAGDVDGTDDMDGESDQDEEMADAI